MMDVVNAFLTALATVLIAVGGILYQIRLLRQRSEARDDATDERLDQLWNAHLRRGESEAKNKRMVTETKDDPMTLILKPEFQAAYAPIKAALLGLRREMKDAKPGQFAEAIEKRFGAWIARHICEVLGVSDYACLRMALLVADDSVTNETPSPAKET